MAGQDGAGGIIRLSTDAFDERDRTEIWREVIGRAVMSLGIDPLPDGAGFHADFTTRVLPGLVFTDGMHSGMQYDRPSSMIDSDDLVFSLVKEGGHVVHQLGR